MRHCAPTLAIVALLSAVLSSGCSSTLTSSAEPWRTAPVERYRQPIKTDTLQPGDKIQILLHTPELQTIPATIDERGGVTLPIIGSVKIAGLTSARAEEAIKQEYVKRKIYKVNAIQVGIMTSEKVFYVEGYVRRPGECEYSRNITIGMAISMVGGCNEFADDRTIWLTRGGQKQKLDRKKDGNTVFVEAGDIIEVPRGWM